MIGKLIPCVHLIEIFLLKCINCSAEGFTMKTEMASDERSDGSGVDENSSQSSSSEEVINADLVLSSEESACTSNSIEDGNVVFGKG